MASKRRGRGRRPVEDHGLRDRPSVRFREPRVVPDWFVARFRKRVLPHLGLSGYKLAEKERVAAVAVHHLVLAGFKYKTVADTRNNALPGVGPGAQVWDAIVRAGYASRALGSEAAGKVTRYYATDKLLAAFDKRKWITDLMDVTLAGTRSRTSRPSGR